MSENQFLPLILLFIFGGFAVLSAVLKARARVTAFSDVVLAVLEGISGMALMAAALPTPGSLESASRIGILTAVLVAVSSTVHMAKVRARSRAREESEGKRPYAALKYGIDGSPSILADTLPEADEPTEQKGLGPQEWTGPSRAITSPLRTFGSNQVDLGGMCRFWRHTSMNSSMVTAGSVTA